MHLDADLTCGTSYKIMFTRKQVSDVISGNRHEILDVHGSPEVVSVTVC